MISNTHSQIQILIFSESLRLDCHILKQDTFNTFDTFTKASASVKPGKAGGHDNITSRDLNLSIGSIIPSIYMVFKRSIESGKFPTSWKRAKVSCHHKKGSKKDCCYRPISLLIITSKAVERSIYLQLKDHLIIFNLHSPHQWVFPKYDWEITKSP